jgi:hypothetical protein
MLGKAGIHMGLFGPSLNEKIRRSAAAALPAANWRLDVDWSNGTKLHRLHGSLDQVHSDAETMQYARDVWRAVTKDYRLDPSDGRDGLLDVSVTSTGGTEQWTGIHG